MAQYPGNISNLFPSGRAKTPAQGFPQSLFSDVFARTAMTMDQAVREYIHDNQDRFLKDIARLVAQPSVSAKNEGVE